MRYSFTQLRVGLLGEQADLVLRGGHHFVEALEQAALASPRLLQVGDEDVLVQVRLRLLHKAGRSGFLLEV